MFCVSLLSHQDVINVHYHAWYALKETFNGSLKNGGCEAIPKGRWYNPLNGGVDGHKLF